MTSSATNAYVDAVDAGALSDASGVASGGARVGSLSIAGSSESIEGALAKIHRVLPAALRRRVEALETTLGFTTAPIRGVPVASETVLLLADAIRRRRRRHPGAPRRAAA